MTLTLSITNADHLDNGESTQLRLDRHGAVIGRSPHSDWSLPDPKNYVSSTHCEIDYRDGAYLLIDKSTNGTFLNGSEQRMSGSHVLRDGDVIGIGQYRVAVSGGGAGRAGAAPAEASPPPAAGAPSAGWAGWNANPAAGGAPAPTAEPSAGWESAPSGWDRKPQPGAGSGWTADVAPDQTLEAGWATPTPAAAPGAPGGGGASGWGAADARATSDWNAVDEGSAPPSGGGWSAPPAPPPSDPAARGSGGWQAPAGPGPSPSDGRSGFGVAPAAPYTPPAADGGAWGKAGAGPAKPAASGWDAIAPARDDTPVAEGRIGGASITGRGAMSQNWAPPRVDNPAPPPPAPASVDVWGAMAASNTVDWSRGGFGDPPAASAPAAFAPAPLAPAPPAAAAPALAPTPTATPSPDAGAWRALLSAAGIPADGLSAPPEQAAATAGAMLKRLVAGLVVMMEARARAKAQLGAQSTTLELKGNNPIKFARSPERVLAQLLNPPERGFMGAADAVEDSFRDLQAHQMATLAAMQGALRATLDRFSPEAIRSRAEMRGVLARILPGARNATLWEAYEREFEGVAKGSDEAFMDVFAKAFKAAYEATSAQMKAQGGG